MLAYLSDHVADDTPLISSSIVLELLSLSEDEESWIATDVKFLRDLIRFLWNESILLLSSSMITMIIKIFMTTMIIKIFMTSMIIKIIITTMIIK